MEYKNINNNNYFIKYFFITSIEKNFYIDRNIDFIPLKNKNLEDFKYTEFYQEEIKSNNILYLNKINCISFEIPSKDLLKDNNNPILLKIKDGTRNYLYDCNIEYNFQTNINNDKDFLFIYNFEIGELRKDNVISSEAIIQDSMLNIQSSLIEIKENLIPQRKLNFEEKFNFFLKALINDKSDNINLRINLLYDTIKEIENVHIKNKAKLEFIELLKLLKIIFEDIYLKNKDSSVILKVLFIFNDFVALFEKLLTDNLIYFNKIDESLLKEYNKLIKSIEENNNLSKIFVKFINIFYGYYEEDEQLYNDLDKNRGLILSDLYKNKLYEPKNDKIKEKLTNILFVFSKDLNEYFLILEKTNSIIDKLKIIVDHFDIFKKLIIENEQNKLILPKKFEDNLKVGETPFLFYPLHKKIIELEISLIQEAKIKSIFDFSEIIKNFINIYENELGTKENYNSFLALKKIIIEEKKVNTDLVESLYKYVNKLIHLNIIELVKKDIIENIDLLNHLHEDEYINDDLYKITDEDFIILNGFKIKDILNQKNNEFFELFNKYEIWNLFCKDKINTKKYIEIFGDMLDNILYLEVFFKILPISNYNYFSLEEVINWVEKNLSTINNNILENEKEKNIFFYNMNILFQICIKTHFEHDKFFSMIENYFIEEIKHKKNINDNCITNGYILLDQLYTYFINNYNTENNNSIPFNMQNRILSFYIKNSDMKINNKNMFINFLNNVIIDKQHLDFEQLLNNLESLVLTKFDLLSDNSGIKFDIYCFLINKFKEEFDDKTNNIDYLVDSRKIIKNFIIKDIEQKGIIYSDANILFNNGINMENEKEKIINRFILCSKIKKNDMPGDEQNINQFYESIYMDLKNAYLNCKVVIDNLENLIQYYLFFGDEKNNNDINVIKGIVNDFKNNKIKDFFKQENMAKINNYKNLFDQSNRACFLKGSLIFMEIYDVVEKKINDPTIQMNIKTIYQIDSFQKVSAAMGSFDNLISLFDKFNKSNVDSFIHSSIDFFYNIELNYGSTILKKELDFVLNYFIHNSKNENEIKICQSLDKNKFIDFVKNLSKREKILYKCRGIKHIINIFLNPDNYVYINQAEKDLEKHIAENMEKNQHYTVDITNYDNNNKEWNYLDFENKLFLNKRNLPNMNNNIINNNENINKISEQIKDDLKGKIANSLLVKKLNEYVANLSDTKISLANINQVINDLDSLNLGINIKELLNNEFDNLNEQQKLIEEFFKLLIDKPEAIYYAKIKKCNEIKNLFQNTSIEIENTLLKDNDIDDFIVCLEKINNFALNVVNMINNDGIQDLPKELVFQFIKELIQNDNNKYLKCLNNYLNKFNQIKSILNEVIASPEVSIKKITKILANSDFIINYNSLKNKYVLYGTYYEQYPSDIKEIPIFYEELENLRERILTMNKNSQIYQETLIYVKIFNNIKKVLETLEQLDRTGYPDKVNIIMNIKNKKINCNYNNEKLFNNLKDLTNNLVEQRNMQIKLFEKYYKENEIMRLFYGKQISLLYNFIRYKDGQEYVDALFQLISKGRINKSYPPKYENYSDNLIEDVIKNICNYSFIVLASNQINDVNSIFTTNEIKIKDEKNESYKGIYLHLSNEEYQEHQILACYGRLTNNLPLYSTILFCNSYTTEEEIIAFLHRSILCDDNILFFIANSNHLEPKQRNTVLITIKTLINKLSSEKKEMVSTLIISSSESNSEIFRALKNFDEPEHPIKTFIFDYKNTMLNLDKVRNNINNTSGNYVIVKSNSTGVGKSRYIRNLPGVFESNLIYMPLGGNLSRKSIYQRLYDSIKKLNIKNLTQVFLYIDLNQTNEHEILKEFLFELIIFKKFSMDSRNSDKIIYISNKFNVYIELPYESLSKVGAVNSNYINQYPIFALIPKRNIIEILLAKLSQFSEEISEDEKKNLVSNPDFELVKTLSDSKLQLVSKTLQLYKNKTINSTPVIPNSTECLQNTECNNLLNEYLSKVELPNFYQKNIFIKLLYDQFLNFHQNTFLNPKNLVSNAKKLKMKNHKNIVDIRETIIKNLIDHAVFFTNGFAENIMKSQERTKEILQMQSYDKRKKLTAELKERENISKLRYEQIHPSLIFFEKGGNDCKIIPTCPKHSEEEAFLINLQRMLKVPKKGDIPIKYNTLKYPQDLSSPELMDELLDLMKGRRISLDVINKILSEYALTPDNYIKMVLILNRINSDIPVILMGETGCGKTSLIKILANIIFKGNLSNLKILNIHSGIEDTEIINFLEQLIRDSQLFDNSRLTSAIDEFNSFSQDYQTNYLLSINKTKEKLFEDFKREITQQKIWVFFDEINASNSMGLLSEILCKKTYLGKKIPERFIFLAACNPYRAMGELNKIDHSLIHKGQEKRKLVYTVYPLPNNMLNFVLDFGNLSLDEEKKYIQIMVRKMMEKIMDSKIKNESEAIINLAINCIVTCQSYIKNTNDISSVSLREVKRFVIFFKYFVIYLLNKKKDTSNTNDQSIIFYTLKTNYEIYKHAVNLSLYICYYLRLPDKKSKLELLKQLNSPNFFNNQFLIVPQLEENYIAKNIIESKENENLSKGVAKNRALLENLFSLYFCTVNKIPLLICGKPGSTKSLSQKLLQNALKGMVSHNKLCKETKELVVFPYQGSINSTSEEIKEVFKKAKNYQRSNKDTIVMVYIDEMGLAEISKKNPLKVIHSELEMNFDFETDNFGLNKINEISKVAFLGISNWSLDASKMNRAIFNVIQEPDLNDLKKTSLEISSSINEQISNKYIGFFDRLTKAYYEYIEQKKRDDRIDVNFHGLRDFYNLIKSTTRELSDIEKDEKRKKYFSENQYYLGEIALKYIERNFSGLPSSVYDFKAKYFKVEKCNYDLKNTFDNNYDIMRCISDNIFDKESRYLLLITKNNLDIDLINFIIDDITLNNKIKYMNNKFETKYLIGSDFPRDNDEEYRENIVSIIRTEMVTNKLLILKDLDVIYTSLYDLLNQDFDKIDNKYYTRISFGYWKPLSLINKNFRLIVIINEKNLCYEDPPFLNRFEKHIFNLDNLLNDEEKNLAKEIYDIVMKLITFEKSKIDLNKHLFNFNLEELEALVYKFSKQKKYINQNIDIIYEVFKKIVPTFTEEIIASIFVSGFKEEKKDIADKILDIYSEYHPSNISDFLYNKVFQQKNVIYTFSSISDDLLFVNNKKKEDNEKDDENINKIEENASDNEDGNKINIINDGMNIININDEDKDIEFNKENTVEIYVEGIKSILDLEKMIDEFLNEENKNLFVLRFSNKEKDLNKMNQINYLIDDCLLKNKNINDNKNEKKINLDKKYFIFLVYLIRDENNFVLNNHDVLLPGIISKLTNNCHHVFIDNLSAKTYDFIKTLTLQDNDLFEFFFIDELEKNIDISFRFMLYEFSKNESKELNSNNYREKMTEKILKNKNIQNILKTALFKISIGTKEILRPLFIIEEDNKKNKNKNKNKKNNTIIYNANNNKGYTDFIELFKEKIFEQTEFYLIKIIFCLEKSQILHSIAFNKEMLKNKLISEKIIKHYLDDEFENQLLMNKISTNFNMKNKLNVILNIKIPYISKTVLIGKIFKYIKDEIKFNYSNNEIKLIDVIKDNSLIEETINDYYKNLNQYNENIYIEFTHNEIIKDIFASNDKYLITSLYQDFLLLFLLDGKIFENGDNFKDFYRIIDILVQLRFLNIQEDNFAFTGKNKTISLLKENDILFNNNITNNKNKNKSGLMIAKILGFLFGYQNEIYTLLEIFSHMSKYIPNLIQIFENIVINKEVKNEISERNPDYCRIVKESFYIVYESLLHSIAKQYNKYNIIESNKNEVNKINSKYDDSDLDDDDEDDDFSLLNNNEINENPDEIDKNLLKEFGDIPIQNIESISKISVLLEKKMLLYSKELFMIKNLSKVFEVLNTKAKKSLLTKANISAITNIICSEQKYINEKNFKILLNNFLLLMELLGKMLGKDSKEYGELVIYLIYNQFLNIKNIQYKVKVLNLIIPDSKKRNKRNSNPIVVEKSLPLLILLFNDGVDYSNKKDKLQPIYNELSRQERKERFLKFAKDENSSQYQLLKIINRPNQVLDHILLYYFEYLIELYFKEIKIKNENNKMIDEEILGNSSLDYLEEALYFLDDEINGNNVLGNKVNYLNKLGKLFSISFVKKYIDNYVYINKNDLYKVFIWENINSILYSKENKIRRIILYYIMKRYSRLFITDNEFVAFNFNSHKIPFNTKFRFKLELNKHQFEYNLIPFNYKSEYVKFHSELSINDFNNYKFYEFITDKNNVNSIDLFFCFFVNSFLLQNFHNDFYVEENSGIFSFLRDKISNLTIINADAKKILTLLIPNEFIKLVKPLLGNKLNLKQYEVFIYALRFCLLSLTISHSNFYSNLLGYNCFKTLSDNFIPGKTITRNIFKDSYDIMKENLTKDPINYGAYLCSCGYHYSVANCTFPTVISNCPICKEQIGGTNHKLIRRPNHIRIFLDDKSRNTKFSLSYADKTMPNMLLDEFYRNIVLKQIDGDFKYCDTNRAIGCNKTEFLKREKVRNLSQIGFRTINFILFSHLFINKVFKFTSDNNIELFKVKDMSLFESLETDWDILAELLKGKNIKSVEIFFNVIYPHVYQLINNVQFFETAQKFRDFENLFEQKINEILRNEKEFQEYEKINSNLLSYDPLSDMAIILEKFPPYIYNKDNFPEMEFFANTSTPTIDDFKRQFSIIPNSEDKYPLLKIILTQDMDKIELLKELPKLNKVANYLLEKCNFQYSRESANNTKIKTELIYNEIKDDLDDFIKSWYKIRPIIENYGCKQFKNNGVKYFTELNTSSPISHFFVDDGEFGHGMVLAAIYKQLIEFQNTFLNQIINSKSEILSCFKEQLEQEIMIQDASINEIIDLDRINKNILSDIVVKNTIPNIFNLYKTEKKIDFLNMNSFEHNYENIEKEIGSLLLPGLRKFKSDELRFITYKYEGFRGSKSSIITNFNEKYPQRELNSEQIKYIFNFIDKEENIDKKNNTNKKSIKKMLFSLQILIDYIQRENYDKLESLYDIIKKLPKQVNICDELKQFFRNDNKNDIKKENDFILLNINNNNENKENKDSNGIYFSISTLISIFELFEHLCWDSYKENLVGDYLQKIDAAWGKKIIDYFNGVQYNPGKIIKRITFNTALRRFISRYLAGKRGENEINENNTLANEILRPELWKPFFTESESFEVEIAEIMSVMTDEFDGSLKVGQALELYNLLGGDNTLLENARIGFEY